MKAASQKELKTELEHRNHSELVQMCLRLARFKKENKELISYLLFESHDEAEYIRHTRESLHILFTEVNTKSLYIAKKNIRKIIRITNRYIRYSGIPETEVELLLYLGEEIAQLDLDLQKSPALFNLYNGILKKANKVVETLHEDLQYDYKRQLEKLLNP